MDLYRAAAEPTSAPTNKFHRLGNFRHSQDLGIEGARSVLPSGRHGELDMIDRLEWNWTRLDYQGGIHSYVYFDQLYFFAVGGKIPLSRRYIAAAP